MNSRSQTSIRKSTRQVKSTFSSEWILRSPATSARRQVLTTDQDSNATDNSKSQKRKSYRKSLSSESLLNSNVDKQSETSEKPSNDKSSNIAQVKEKSSTKSQKQILTNKSFSNESDQSHQSKSLSIESFETNDKSTESPSNRSSRLRKSTQNSFTPLNDSPVQSTKKSTKNKSIQKPTQESSKRNLNGKPKQNETISAKKSRPKEIEETDEQSGEFKCSKCVQVFKKLELAKKHIIIAHYGLARLNDSNNEFSEREIMSGYKAAIHLLKTLRCFLCNKSFGSALGLKFHSEICGKKEEDLKRKCDLCGNMLKFSSMKSHMDMHERKKQSTEQAALKETSLLVQTEPEHNLLQRPIRNSAKKAKEFLKSTADDEEDSDLDQQGKKKKRKTSQDDNYSNSDSSNTDDQSSEGSMSSTESNLLTEDLSKASLKISTQKSLFLFKHWREHFDLPEKLADVIRKSTEKTDFFCDLCKQAFSNKETFEFHYLKCDTTLDSNWSCKFCDFKTESNLISLFKHFIEKHLSELDKVPVKIINSLIAKKTRKDYRSSIPSYMPSYIDDSVQFHSLHFKEKVYEDWIFDTSSVSLIDKTDLEQYLPERKCSAKFKFKTLDDKKKSANNAEDVEVDENKDENNETSANKWKTLNLFESMLNRHHATFYTGGPVYSAAWCPFSISDKTANLDQILCLSTSVKTRIYNVFDCNQLPGCLQFWNFGPLENKSTDAHKESAFRKPKLEFIIAHDYGTISEMVWCPGGTSYLPKKNQKSTGRLGLLALACTDGHVRILSVPLLENIRELSNEEPRAFKLEPIVILEKHPVCLSLFNKATICKSLSWAQTDGQRYIVAGYGNGLISIFDLKTNSSLLKKVSSSTSAIELKPKKTWIGHGACVNSIKWLPLTGCTYIVSAGFDRYVKVWSLEDMVSNIVLPKKTVITNVQWSFKYTGCYFSSDDCYSNLHNNVIFRDLTSGNFSNSISRHKCCVWDFDISDWSSTEIGVDASGETILSVYARPKNGKKYNKTRPYECLPVYRLTYESLTDGEEVTQAQAVVNKGKIVTNINYLIAQEKPVKSTLDEMVDSYGLVFNDIDLSLYSKIPRSEFERLKAPENMNYPRLGDYPLISLNKVQFNPNQLSNNYVFTGGESGLSRVSYVEFLKNPFFSIRN